jgi:hypothetical protein
MKMKALGVCVYASQAQSRMKGTDTAYVVRAFVSELWENQGFVSELWAL